MDNSGKTYTVTLKIQQDLYQMLDKLLQHLVEFVHEKELLTELLQRSIKFV